MSLLRLFIIVAAAIGCVAIASAQASTGMDSKLDVIIKKLDKIDKNTSPKAEKPAEATPPAPAETAAKAEIEACSSI